ncbi:MAG TPA: LL-diaminopimelate aminotransferase [Thermoclostridium caenicola]|uniref:LL-diaminopimelate aminotransferase n=1 Tax=Thermoclostridium caenicola TaxID=659425 RepID=A0A1M6BPY9_9FIRM|nr:LL-diaminopimelate aminotransferase [Thermoclostridium caenicola]SHI50835.1 LL-diaminopimelate aminotransferase apoenzyme [Thermoclostridium caenicola]HOK42337.1 LL-diaminopimelate aminotransferase [Thermoclostridium caenicola]HOL84192.1 LL-diaminopimelate aminotransferase [Thermoclostridium caenicola]HOP71772.1 LL-diaminopimelate aminotransferase [Thermoclostridium caenicola]HPO75960.1 LL-diaminopimelate aminotransferase [Thermoclostridium caenicola]
MLINSHFGDIKETYLFSEIAKRVNDYKAANPTADIIRLGIGDVTQPLPPVAIQALHEAVDEMARAETFRGYGPEQGYDFLREAIAVHDFKARGCDIEPDEIFVSDGAKSDTANFTDLFGDGNIIGISNPVYPVYLDSNVLAGHAGSPAGDGYQNIRYLDCLEENGFKPQIPDGRLDIVYLCSPNNPSGVALTRDDLKKWVDYALANKTLILYDAAYESFIREDGIPHSIYEIPEARKVAVEFRSFSKTAGFTGLRCAYTVVPKTLEVTMSDSSKPLKLHAMWLRRQTTKFNGVPYIVQRAAAALYTPEGREQIRKTIDLYLENAKTIRSVFEEKGFKVWGGINSPYVWLKVPEGMTSWQFFDELLHRYHIVGTPGSGFGTRGEGYFRLTGFGSPEKTREAAERLRRI